MKTLPRLLIVDDEKNTREGLARSFRLDWDVITAENAEAALRLMRTEKADVILSDLRMPGLDGLAFLERLRAGGEGAPPCVIMTAYADLKTGIAAMKAGAWDFITKPLNLDAVEEVLKSALKASRQRLPAVPKTAAEAVIIDANPSSGKLRSSAVAVKTAAVPAAVEGLPGMLGVSSSMQEVFDLVRRVAPARSTVLISGESGTGKEGVARALHALSDRSAAPFVAVHCAALNANLLESELFGHEKGAFTSATGRRAGRFEAADGGTVFLDEIGEIDASIQVKLLRVLETRSFERVGGSETLRVDVRIVAATNRDLKRMVEEGKFREDLYYRLDVIRVHLPPLRERPDDIPALLAAALGQACADNRRQIRGFTSGALALLVRHPWPGNVRELRNVVEGSVVRCRGDLIDVGDLPAGFGESPRPALAASPEPRRDNSLDVGVHERNLILEALRRANNSRTEAAKLLGMSRRTLHRRLQELGLESGEG